MDNQTLHRLTPLSPAVEKSLRNATLHALGTEGSFSRAKLTEGLGLGLGLNKVTAERLGAGIEMFHLASLLLDDLPCMDNAELRRSNQCTHRIYGENTTILSALGLINQAYFHLWQIFAQSGKSIQDEASRLTRDCLGFEGILDGQSKDLHYHFTYNDGSMVSEIAEKKTGSLLRLCLLLPAILAEASRYEKLQLSHLAQDWGLAYQIADDLKDLYYSKDVSGKTSHRDAELGRPNMALAIGEASAAQLLNALIQSSHSKIEALRKSGSPTYGTLLEFQLVFTGKAIPILEAYAAA
jgi:geranylgeranyl diphosphate synthase, type II